MLTKDILFGMNTLTLAGFVVMGSHPEPHGTSWKSFEHRPDECGDGFGIFRAI
jgi:hypothetical protein